MKVHAARKNVRAGQSFKTQLCTIRTTTDRFYFRSHTAVLHSMQHQIYHVHLRVNLLLHIVVLVLCFKCYSTLTIFLVHRSHHAGQCALALLKTVAVVVAYNVVHARLLNTSLYTQQVIESLITLGSLRALIRRQHRSQFHRQQVGIHHLVLGIARMHAYTFYIYLGAGSIKVLKLQLAHIAAIHRVAPFATEFLYIKVVRAHTNLLVRVKGHANIAVLYLLVVAQVAHRFYYLGYARLVVGTKQRGAVSHNQVLACVLQQLGEFGGTHHNTLRKQNIAAVVVVYDMRVDISTRAVGTGIVVRNKSDGRNLIFRVGL